MKKNRILVLSALMCALPLASCGKDPAKGPETNTPTYVSTIDTLVQVGQRNSFVTYGNNIKQQSNKLIDFAIKDSPYMAGTLNPFKLGPALSYMDTDGNAVSKDDAHPENWTKGWKLELKEGNEVVDSSKYTFDSVKCELTLKDALDGKTLTATVTPNADEDKGVNEAKAATFKKEFTFKVVKNAYNVYTGLELNYFDDRDEATGLDYGNGSGTDGSMVIKEKEFKRSKGLNADLNPTTLLLQNDIQLTADDVSPEYIYTVDQLPSAALKEKAVGSWKDYTFPFMQVNDRDMTVNGNYFKLNMSEFPLVVRHVGGEEIMGNGGAVSHAAFFRIQAGTASFENMSIIGNGPNYVEEGDEKYAGGDILIKAGGTSSTVQLKNVLAAQHFITAMSEDVEEGYPATNFVVDSCKFSDNYNSFIYNWGGKMECKNCYMGGCGGPVCIQDHTDVSKSGPWESQSGDIIFGHAPVTIFEDCELVNFVHGQEAWFKQFGATELVPTIKAMSDLYKMTVDDKGQPLLWDKTFLTKKQSGEYVPAEYGDGTEDNNRFFNFLVLNKSSSAQGMTAFPVCGEVKFINNQPTKEETTFNYLKADKVENYVSHMALRNINQNGGPVFETNGGVGAVLNPSVPHIEAIDSVNDQLGTLYELAGEVYGALHALDAMGVTDNEARIKKILHDDDYLRAALAQVALIQMGQTVQANIDAVITAKGSDNEVAAFIGAVFELIKDQARQQAVAKQIADYSLPADTTYDTIESVTSGLITKKAIDDGIKAMLAENGTVEGTIKADEYAAQFIYPIFRPMVVIANMQNTGLIYSEELGLLDVTAVSRGLYGVPAKIELSSTDEGYAAARAKAISEAITNIYSAKYHHGEGAGTWDTYEFNDQLDWAKVLNIAELANKFESDVNMTVPYAMSIATTLNGDETSIEHFGDRATEYTAIYYNGMMLVMGLMDLAA